MKKFMLETAETILGAFIMAIAVSLFLLPNELSSGGFSGGHSSGGFSGGGSGGGGGSSW